MSSLSVKVSPGASNWSALGRPAAASYLGQNFAGAPSTAQVQIRWKPILLDAVEKLGGTEPMYLCQDTMDGMFQVRVSFGLPLNRTRTSFKDIVVTGEKRSTLHEAETEASAAALQELQYGCLSMLVVDVSRTRCRELEKTCYEILRDACELYDGVKSLLSDWEDDMHKAELCYSPERESSRPRGHGTHGEMRADVADELAKLNRAQYLKLKEFSLETEQLKNYIDKVHNRVEYFFCEPSPQQGNEHRGSLPQESKLSMKLILQEMMISLGWEWPAFSVTCSLLGMYVCETTILPNNVHVGAEPKKLTIIGPEASSKGEAVESSCRACILVLEREKSICLVDLNYSRRSHGELYVVEAKEAVQSASFMGAKVLGQWEEMVDEICKCEEHCQKIAAEHYSEAGASLLYRITCSSGKAVSGLRKTCLADLELAKHRFKNGGRLMEE